MRNLLGSKLLGSEQVYYPSSSGIVTKSNPRTSKIGGAIRNSHKKQSENFQNWGRYPKSANPTSFIQFEKMDSSALARF